MSHLMESPSKSTSFDGSPRTSQLCDAANNSGSNRMVTVDDQQPSGSNQRPRQYFETDDSHSSTSP